MTNGVHGGVGGLRLGMSACFCFAGLLAVAAPGQFCSVVKTDVKPVIDGVWDKAQQEWLMETGKAAKRPFLVGAHHPIKELKVGDKPLVAALCPLPGFAGYVHGHDHRWYQLWHHVGYSDRKVQRSACLPSTGWWGDIGFATLRTFPDRAELALVENDFFFPKPLAPGEARPREWDDILAANRGAVCTFRF